ncbi:MAG: DUF3445 domain-containing protein [Pseudomonadota bacterium]
MSEIVLQRHIPYPALVARALPSLQPLDRAEWLIFDEAEAGQIAERKRLIAERRDAVIAHLPGSERAQAEALEMIGAHLRARHGRAPRLERFEDLAAAIQEDVVLLEKRGDAHVMTAALLCFPASWRLSEKIGRPMQAIHAPVAEIGPRMDRQIERVFETVRKGRALWHYNQLWYSDPALFQPRSPDEPRPKGARDYLRSERQCLLPLPRTGALIFTIHTYVVARADLQSSALASR